MLAGLSIHNVTDVKAVHESAAGTNWVELTFVHSYGGETRLDVFCGADGDCACRLATNFNLTRKENTAPAEQPAEDRRVPRYPDPAEAAE